MEMCFYLKHTVPYSDGRVRRLNGTFPLIDFLLYTTLNIELLISYVLDTTHVWCMNCLFFILRASRIYKHSSPNYVIVTPI